ncbi:cysteinyl-tRNA synthetase, unknown class [Fervidobacterium changbaicum]|uniref:Endo alpha-1,4 polygalactosaminidase n=2 Tax=Fervidobacterium TaxID=2422 RepID=A0AAI8CKB6_FERIS|nr:MULTISPECIES: endo alpha-1,4 polygalactosaminidase [Fervidobacterium]AMW32087.1 endo alpha-1,4 polygalactosaminidase [Fervidobacterium islandicum]QAV33882.1 glycoside hydrolase [Fervidobacterium changbaicum]SDH83441.1 cysteinyl-tRNA synthetase, unknown class [Fervidobacterium changbaicum]
MENSITSKIVFTTVIVVFLFPFILNLFAIEVPQDWILYTNGPKLEELMPVKTDLVVIDYSADGTDKKAFKREDLAPLKAQGKKVFAYLNFAVAEDWRFYWKSLNKALILGPLGDWPGEYYVKYWYSEWYDVVKQYMKKITTAGFDGVVLDWINVYQHSKLQQLSGKSENGLKMAIVENLRKLIKDFPNIEYVLINGEDILIEFPEFREKVKYVLVESLFFHKAVLAINTKEFFSRLNKLTELQKYGITILSVEYIDNGNPFDSTNAERINTYVSLARKYGFRYYIARLDMKLNAVNVPRVPTRKD